jgi:hypothetical protein
VFETIWIACEMCKPFIKWNDNQFKSSVSFNENSLMRTLILVQEHKPLNDICGQQILVKYRVITTYAFL